MQNIINWLLDHWQLVVSVGLFVLSFILQLLKKKPVKVIDGVRKFILEQLPSVINLAETAYGAKQGETKFNFVYQTICSLVGVEFGVQPRKVPDLYGDFISSSIEEILSTPHKNENK